MRQTATGVPAEPGVCRNFIGGRWMDGRGGRVVEDIDPATGEVLARVMTSAAEDVADAVDAAAAAFDSWRRTPAPVRGEILFRAAQIMVDRKEELATLMVREMGKVIKEARGDVQEAIDMTFYMAGEGRRLEGYTTTSELRDKFAMCVRDPIGVVVGITPWNFPLAIPAWKVMPALICGNTMVLKPATDTPLLSGELVSILSEAGLPPGALNMVVGPGGALSGAFTADPRVALISFTGSTDVGRALAVEATRRLKRVSLEMGGKNGIIVLGDADLDLAVEGILWSAFGTTGQRCTAASRVIVESSVAGTLTRRLVDRARALRLGPGLEPGTDVGPVVNRAQLEKVHGYTGVALEEGAELLCGGRPATEGRLARGFFYEPTVLGNVRPAMRIAQEEVFGPVASIIEANDLDDAVGINNATGYGLSTSIYTRNVNAAFRAMRDITTGLVYVNAGTIGAEVHLPFGGTRGTGNGHREAGKASLDIFSEWKTVFVDYSGRLQKAQVDHA